MTAGPGERVWVLDVPFEERALASALGARWDAGSRQTVWVGAVLPRDLVRYAAADFSWARWVQDTLNPTPTPVTGDPGVRFTARPHQVAAAAAIMRAERAGSCGFVLADDVGLGKTISAWTAVLGLSRPVRTVLVVCPLGVVPHWRRTIAALGTGGARVVVINYDRLKHLLEVPQAAKDAKRRSTANRRTAAQGASLVDWDVVILDEAHQVRRPLSQRSMAAARLTGAHLAPGKGPFTIWMSATIGQDPTEVPYLAPLVAQATGTTITPRTWGPWLEKHGFAVTVGKDRWAWTEDRTVQAQDVARLRGWLFGGPVPVGLRRRPTDIAGWPPAQRALVPVDLDPTARRLYEEAWTAFRAEIGLARRGRDPKRGLVARLRFRQKASLLRVPGTVAHVMDLLDNGHQVAVSVEFLESLDAIADALGAARVPVAVMDGRDPSGREAQRVRFQTGAARVVLFTPTDGFSLHAGEALGGGRTASATPRSTVVHDPRYSGIQALQIEGRAHRDGQFALVYYPFATGTVEEHVLRTLLGRVSTTKELVGDDVTTVRAVQDALDTWGDPVPAQTGQRAPARPVPPAASPPTPTRPVVGPVTTPAVAGPVVVPAPRRGPVRPRGLGAHPADGITQVDDGAFRRALSGRE